MSSLDEVPFTISEGFSENIIPPLDLNIPDCSELLVSTVHDFSFERNVLDWVRSTYRKDSGDVSSGSVVPSAPPCPYIVAHPEETEDSSSTSEDPAGEPPRLTTVHYRNAPLTIRRCHSLSAADVRSSRQRGIWLLPEWGNDGGFFEEDGYSEDDEYSTSEESDKEVRSIYSGKYLSRSAPQHSKSPPALRPKTSPTVLSPPTRCRCCRQESLSVITVSCVNKRKSLGLYTNTTSELENATRRISELVHPLNGSTGSIHEKRPTPNNHHARNNRHVRYGPASHQSWTGSLTPSPPSSSPRCCGSKRPHSAGAIPPIRNHKPTTPSLSRYACLPPSRPLSSHRLYRDSTADVLSALSQEERDIIEAVMALGYPIRRAILTLQRIGRQSLEQVLSYLSACDRLCKQGYEEELVEEAMEMFQNSEKKASEFLHLLLQFNDMGFRQDEIKEVLLLCENHGDEALEELMMRAQ